MLEMGLIILVVFFDTMMTWTLLGSLIKKINKIIFTDKEESKGFGSTIGKIISGLISFIYGGFLIYIYLRKNFSFELSVLFFLIPIIIFLLMVIANMINGSAAKKESK